MIIRKIFNKFLLDTWNIAIADIGEDMTPINIRWMKHDFTDRWFADPFFLEETQTTFVILAEEFIRGTGLGNICKLFIDKTDCRLIKHETILDLESHLSFPNIIVCGGESLVYPENSAAGHLTFYLLAEQSLEQKATIPIPMIDSVLMQKGDEYYLLGTLPEDANGGRLHVYKSKQLFGPYKEFQQITFGDNIARRAGNVFKWQGKMIAPAQVCNFHYGEGISFQEIKFTDDGFLLMNEIKRLSAKKVTKMTGFHTYNVMGNHVVIDGYQYGSEFIHDAYFKIRGYKNM